MSEKLNSAIAVVGIDIGKNSFHVVGLDRARCDCAAAEVVAWPGGSTLCQHATVPDRHGGLRRRASSQPQAQGAWSRCPADAGEVRAALLEGTEERLPRRGGDRRGGAAADDEVRGDQDRRSARPAGVAPGARAAGQPAHRHHQSDPRLPAGARHCGAAGATLLARRVAGHPGHATRCPVATHGADHRGPGRRLAPAR